MSRFWLGLVLMTLQLSAAGEGHPAFHIGVTNRRFLAGDESYDWRGAETHALLTTIWYPTATGGETQQWVGDADHPFAKAGRAVRDAPPSQGKFPLILLSHGTGGSALMMAWLGTTLAENGFIVAAVNHPGNNALEPYTVQGFTQGWERAEDLTRILDGMLADEEFAPRIDPRRVGAAGFSFGGYTMMELAGGIGDLSTALTLCDTHHPTNPVCSSPPEFPNLIGKAVRLARADPAYRRSFGASRLSHRDPRIRAVFAIAPGAGQTFTPQSLASITIPVEIVAGAGDPIVPPDANARYLAAHTPHARLVIYPGAVGHYTFLDTCTDFGKKHTPGLCVDRPGVDRDGIHAEAAIEAVRFFDETLAR